MTYNDFSLLHKINCYCADNQMWGFVSSGTNAVSYFGAKSELILPFGVYFYRSVQDLSEPFLTLFGGTGVPSPNVVIETTWGDVVDFYELSPIED